MSITRMALWQANSWQQISPSGSPPAGRHGHAAVWCHTVDGMYVFGGGSGGGALADAGMT